MQSKLEVMANQMQQLTADIDEVERQINDAQGSAVIDAPLRVKLRELLTQRDGVIRRMNSEKARLNRLKPNKRRRKS